MRVEGGDFAVASEWRSAGGLGGDGHLPTVELVTFSDCTGEEAQNLPEPNRAHQNPGPPVYHH